MKPTRWKLTWRMIACGSVLAAALTWQQDKDRAAADRTAVQSRPVSDRTPPRGETAQPNPAGESAEPTDAPYNLAWKTKGGTQLWTDLLVHGDWRIQRNCATGHCRLLDDHNVRRAWGSYDQCAAQYRVQRNENNLPPLPERVVLLVHGLMGSRSLLTPLQTHLRQQGLSAMSVSYASTRASIDEHAEALEQVIRNLGPGVKRIDFVGHSMGNIVIRRYLAMHPPPSLNCQRLGRFVMIAPPNQGAYLAKLLCDNAMFRLVAGDSGRQLGDFEQYASKLAVPSCPFGIIAGGGSTLNPLIAGDDDLLVGIEETKLKGARDFIVVDSLHRSLPKQPETLQYVHRFLQRGHFVSERKRHPLTGPPLAAGP